MFEPEDFAKAVLNVLENQERRSKLGAAGEAFALGAKAGLDPQQLYDVIGSSAGTSRMFQVRGPMMVQPYFSFSSRFPST